MPASSSPLLRTTVDTGSGQLLEIILCPGDDPRVGYSSQDKDAGGTHLVIYFLSGACSKQIVGLTKLGRKRLSRVKHFCSHVGALQLFLRAILPCKQVGKLTTQPVIAEPYVNLSLFCNLV